MCFHFSTSETSFPSPILFLSLSPVSLFILIKWLETVNTEKRERAREREREIEREKERERETIYERAF